MFPKANNIKGFIRYLSFMQAVKLILFFSMLIAAIWAIILSVKKRKVTGAPVTDDRTLSEHVSFYRRLDHSERERFRQEADDFLQQVAITAVNTVVTDTDKILIAAGAVIPMFAFKGWRYPNLKEVLVYNDSFNMNFETQGEESRNILGLVGTGVYRDKMMISKNALQHGFSNDTDLSNTAIHEFVHLIDGADGATDGLPEILLDKAYILPWMELIHREMEKMKEPDSDINPYGYTNRSEFFAVVSEYFFEKPELFEQNHPELFRMMEKAFRTKKSDPPGDAPLNTY